MNKVAGRSNQLWIEEEVVVLCAIFASSKFSVGDDERTECKKIANCFDRSPATVDRQWRNIKKYMSDGDPNIKISNMVKKWSDVLLLDRQLVQRLAIIYCREKNWPLKNLVCEA